ncbi:MAG: hypothetical protein MPJ50_03130 [Pirellulales bacterium]|nr:hypothetical protein [Pirellulales bacterium]
MRCRIPKIRLHKASGNAFMQWKGRRIYLGRFGTSTAEAKYHEVLAACLAGDATRAKPTAQKASKPAAASVAELILAFLSYAEPR